MELTTLHSDDELWGPETWVAPLGLAEFARTHWCRGRPVAITGSEERASRLLACVERSAGPVKLPANETGTATVRLVRDGRLISATMNREDAEKLLDAGETVNVFQPECMAPFARDFARAFHAPDDRVECNAYFSRSGGVTPMHFDASESIIIQLRGTKVWRLAPNEIQNPLEHSALAREPHMGLRLHFHDEWPREEPASAVDFVATPGSVLYLPRGLWHATASRDDSLSLHYHYKTATWVDVLWPVLYRELVRDPEWRAASWGASGIAHDAQAEATVSRLLQRAVESLEGMVADDVLRRGRASVPPLGPAKMFRRRPGIGLGFEGTEEDGSKRLRAIVPDIAGERVASCAIAPELGPVVLWIASRHVTARFRAEDAPRPAGVEHEDVAELFGVLEEAGVLARD